MQLRVASIVALVLLVIAMLGGTANIAYWVYRVRQADSLDTPIFQARTIRKDSRRLCDRKVAEEARRRASGLEGISSGDDVLAGIAPDVCESAQRAHAKLDRLEAEQQWQRSEGWRAVRWMAAWPVLGAFAFLLLRRRGL